MSIKTVTNIYKYNRFGIWDSQCFAIFLNVFKLTTSNTIFVRPRTPYITSKNSHDIKIERDILTICIGIRALQIIETTNIAIFMNQSNLLKYYALFVNYFIWISGSSQSAAALTQSTSYFELLKYMKDRFQNSKRKLNDSPSKAHPIRVS